MSAVRYLRLVDNKFAFYPQSFNRRDLRDLETLLQGADEVVPLREIQDRGAGTVGLRHDVDHNLEHAVNFGEWEAERGFRASYFVLPEAWYAKEPDYVPLLERLVSLGHEVGLHSNVCQIAAEEGELHPVDGSALPAGFCERPAEIMREQLAGLRALDLDVVGTAAHGSGLADNLSLWATGYVPADFGLQYEAYHLHRAAHYISDNRGRWQTPYEEDATSIEISHEAATHLLLHPCHWQLPR